MTGLGMFGFLSPIGLTEGTCLNFLVSISSTFLEYSFFSPAKISIISETAKGIPEKLDKPQSAEAPARRYSPVTVGRGGPGGGFG